MADINLLPTQERESAKEEALKKKLQFSSVAVLVIVAILTIATLGVFMVFASENSNLVAQVEQESARVNQLKAQEELLVVVKDKTSTGSTILSQREDFPDFFEKLGNLVPQDLYFTDMKTAEGELIISGKARTSADVAGFVNSLVGVQGAEIVSNISVDSLTSDDTGVYSFVVSGLLVDGGGLELPGEGAD